MVMAAFARRKEQRLARADGSRKGSVDARAAAVVELLNGQARFCTASSCAGRVLLAQLLAADANRYEVQKKNCSWLMVTHEMCIKDDVVLNSVTFNVGFWAIYTGELGQLLFNTLRYACAESSAFSRTSAYLVLSMSVWIEYKYLTLRQVCLTWLPTAINAGQFDEAVRYIALMARTEFSEMTALEKATGDIVFKFEPFVLHVLCEELQDAQLLHSVAINSGFRNSGITVGRRGKIMMAVRSTHCLEVPLSHMGKLMVSEEYIEFLIHTANQKMAENMRRIDRFYNCLQLALKTAVSANNSPSEEREKNHCVYVHRRKRKTIQKHGVCTSPKDHNKELEHEDDPKSNVDIFGEIMV